LFSNLHFKFSHLEVMAAQVSDPGLLFDKLIQKGDDDPAVKDEQIPYWAEIWPSSIALAGYIAGDPGLVKGKSVLEIGCGSALPGIVSGLLGGYVELTDYLPEAIELAAHNWKLNLDTQPRTSLLDWRNPGKKSADVIIASDIAYERRSFKPVVSALKTLVNHPGGIILLSEPNRKFTGEFFSSLRDNGFIVSETKKKVEKDGIHYNISIYLLRR
jgi:predicted nicotinamide N-methyase